MDQFALELWLEGESQLSVNHRELLAVWRGLLKFRDLLQGHVITVFCDNTTAVSYLRHQGGMYSSVLNGVSQEILCWAGSQEFSLLPQFVLGHSNIVADVLSCPHQVIGAEWTLHQEVFNMLRKKWQVTIDLFASSLESLLWFIFCSSLGSHGCRHQCHAPVLGLSHGLRFPAFRLNSSGVGQAASVSGRGPDSDRSILASEEMVPRYARSSGRSSSGASSLLDLLRQPHVRRFHQNLPVLRLPAWRDSSSSQEP